MSDWDKFEKRLNRRIAFAFVAVIIGWVVGLSLFVFLVWLIVRVLTNLGLL